MTSIRTIWKYSLVITLPVTILFVLWAARTYTLYKTDRFQFSSAQSDTLLHVGTLNYYYLLDYLRDSIFRNNKKADFNIYVNNREIHELNANLPYSGLGGENYKPAYMVYPDGKLEDIQLRYRGDSPNHWLLKEKSYRVKTRKKKLLNNMRKFNLIVHESAGMLGPHLSYGLAEIIGLPAPKSELVSLNINGKSHGEKLFLEQIDESFLRKRGFMPGDIYSGDNTGLGRYWGLDLSLFKSAIPWEKAAANNHYELDSKLPLEAMISGLERNDFSTLDLNQFGKFAAYMDILRTLHHDESHNWKLHYDHYLEKLSPLVWDSAGWSELGLRLNQQRGGIANSTFMKKLYSNHDFLYARQTALINFYKNQSADFQELLESSVIKAKERAEGLDYLVDVFRTIWGKEEVLREITQFRDTVNTVLQEVEAATVATRGSYSYSLLDDGVRLKISKVPVSAVEIYLKDHKKHGDVKLRYTVDGATKLRDVSNVTKSDGQIVLIQQRLFPASQIKLFDHSFKEATYDIVLDGIASSDIESIQVIPLTIAAEKTEAILAQTISPIEFTDEHSIVQISRSQTPVVLSGVIHVDDFRVIENDLVIEPGTRLVFSEGAGLKALGKVTAVGTSDMPITFTAADPDKSWGAVAVKDENSNGSVFEHCIFEYGSGIKGDLFEYTAMLSIHNVQDFLIKNSIFRDSLITDDMLHVVYGDIRIESTTFQNSHSDAVDLDITTATIIDSRFLNSGNDAVDLMTSTAVINGSEFSGSKDKGVSIGENSRLLTVNSYFRNNHIALESKDSSTALVANSKLTANATAIHAYQKNWQYGDGGEITVRNSVIEKNLEIAKVGKKSRVTIVDSYADTLPEKQKGLSLVSTDSDSREASQYNQPLEFEREKEFFEKYRLLLDDSIRGVPPHSN